VSRLDLLLDYRPRVRLGIATGLVVVGDIVGTAGGLEQDVAGETPNLAARLMGLAEPNTVVVAAITRRLNAGLFDYRELGAVPLKGFPHPVPAWQVIAPSAAESRFEAQRAANLTPFVGRGEELDGLLGLWREAVAGTGRIALISGEPGIGKSRLAAVLQQRL